MKEVLYHIQVIQNAFTQRQRLNSSYSLRAFSRDIGIDSSTLSQIFSGRRKFPVKKSDQVIRALSLSPVHRMKFLDSLTKGRSLLDSISISQDEQVLIDESHYRVLSEWEHYAALTLLDMSDFDFKISSVSKRLGISSMRASVVIQNLLESKLLIRDSKGKFQKAQSSVRTSDDISSQALRDSHFETLNIGRQKLEEIPIDLRDFSSINFAFDLSQMTELKLIIREFRKKVSALAKSGNEKTEVFQLAIQTYPLTEIMKEE